MVKCTECKHPISKFKLLFKSDYSIIECSNCGNTMKIKRNRNKVLDGILGGVGGLAGYLLVLNFGFVKGIVGLIVFVLIIMFVHYKRIDNEIEIIHK